MSRCNVPYLYDYTNVIDSFYSPSEIHVADTRIVNFYARYLMQKAMSPFKWTLPDHWAENYFLYTLYELGYVAVVNTDKFGVIPQACGLQGYTVFYQPSHAVIANPLLRGTLNPRIGTQCTLIRLQPDYNGISDIVKYHAGLLGLAYESLSTNLLNSKLAFVAYAENKGVAESLKKLYDEVARGVPAVVQHRRNGDTADSPPFELINQQLSQNFLAPELLAAMRTIERHFDNEIGIPVNMTEGRKERAITAEVTTNNFESQSRMMLWLDMLKKSCKETRDMFGIDIDVDWREELNGGNLVDTGVDAVGQGYSLVGTASAARR